MCTSREKKRKGSRSQTASKRGRMTSEESDKAPDEPAVAADLEISDLAKQSHLIKPETSPHLPSLSEVEELEHVLINLTYYFEQLVEKFHWISELDVDKACEASRGDARLHSMLTSFRIRLATTIIKQYWSDELPLLDYLSLAKRFNQVAPQVSLPLPGSIDPERVNELQTVVLETAIRKLTRLKVRATGDAKFYGSFGRTRADSLTPSSIEGHEMNSVDCAAQPDTWPPSLPRIQDEALLSQVFTHKSSLLDPLLASKMDKSGIHNERLEFKGDAILDFIVCEMIYDEFPMDSEGTLSQKKAMLVCNNTLFDLSVTYGLHERLKIGKDLHNASYSSPGDLKPDSTVRNKAFADVFEAYIAGVAIDQGLDAARTWLRSLYKPLVDDLKTGTPQKEVNLNSKNELYRKVGSAQQIISYQRLEDETPHTVACLINGIEYSRATDRSTKLASLRAAETVLSDSSLVERLAAQRREIPRTAPTTTKQ